MTEATTQSEWPDCVRSVTFSPSAMYRRVTMSSVAPVIAHLLRGAKQTFFRSVIYIAP